MTILETKELKKYYDSGEYITKALDGVSLEIEEGCYCWRLREWKIYIIKYDWWIRSAFSG